MGGEGSMSSANTILKNNRSLLRKKRMFDKENQVEVNSKKGFQKERYVAKKLSEKELRSLRRKRLKEAAKEKKYRFLLVIIIIISFSFLGMQFFHVFKTHNELVDYKLSAYKTQLNIGDAHALRNEWDKAILSYKKAVKVLPYMYEANARMLQAYISNCIESQKDCDQAIELLEEMYDNFPSKKAELYSIYLSIPR